MQRESNWRYYFILAVTILCLVFIFPTGRLVAFLLTEPVPQESQFQENGQLDEGAFNQATDEYEKKKAGLQRASIKLGLDLIGGADALLRVDEDSMKDRLLGDMRRDIFDELSAKRIGAKAVISEDGNGLRLTLDDPADALRALDAINYMIEQDRFEAFNSDAFVNSGMVILQLSTRYLRSEISDSVETAEKVIRERVDEFGVTQPSVSLQRGSEGISGIRVQVPGEKDPEYVIQQIIRPAQLEFFLLHEGHKGPNGEFNPDFALEYYEKKMVENVRGEEREEFVPRADKRLPAGYIGIPGDIVTDQNETIKRMYIVRYPAAMDGAYLREAYVQTDPTNLTSPINVGIAFDGRGAAIFRRLTRENIGEFLAISLDRKVYSAPVIRTVIPNGQAVIEGTFTSDEARDLALVLKAGALPADLEPAEQRLVGPTLGQESITQSLYALAIGGAAITVFMILYYGTAGLVSVLALILNLLVIVACLDLFNATLTLSGIGGIILTIGMAVDANVLIYERNREELENGRPLQAAIRGGFGRAFSVIFDSNLTTLLAAFVLLQFGEGSVQGFALTMAFGLLANLFTGLTVTYALCALWFRIRGGLSLGVLHIFRNPKINFIGMRYGSFTISAALILFCVGNLIYQGGPKYAVDFEGGVLTQVRVTTTTENQSEAIKEALSNAGLPGEQAKVQAVRAAENNDYLVRLGIQPSPAGEEMGDTQYTQQRLEGALKAHYSDGVTFLGSTSVSSEVGQEFQEIALVVILSASFCILLYLWFRFELVFGVAAVIALLHDLIITLGIITLLNVQISLDIVSALLILLGFSVNDTIVIFDRVRENSHSMFGQSFKDICNSAMNKTLSRTLITSGTTVGIMLVMFFFGGRSLAPFALTLIVGGLVGTYSSDFVAAPLVYWWNDRQRGRVVEQIARKSAGVVDAEAGAGAPAMATAGSAGAQPAGQPQRRGRR
ncbi:protein translocase subunit SecD [bacterium]|nr:protein translocase subunit SecD [bacterium]